MPACSPAKSPVPKSGAPAMPMAAIMASNRLLGGCSRAATPCLCAWGRVPVCKLWLTRHCAPVSPTRPNGWAPPFTSARGRPLPWRLLPHLPPLPTVACAPLPTLLRVLLTPRGASSGKINPQPLRCTAGARPMLPLISCKKSPKKAVRRPM